MENEKGFEGKWYAHPVIRNALISGILTGSGFGLSHLGIIPQYLEISLYIMAIPIGGYHWMKEGIEELIKERKICIEALMFSATIGSAILGMWDEAAFLVLLYGAAEGLEEYTYDRTRGSIRKLLDLAPKQARILKNGKEETIPAQNIAVGNIFLVKPGEAIATDGMIVQGNASINESAVTGESIPTEKNEGMHVFAATVNQDGMLQIKATTIFANNTLSKMIHLVEVAQEQKSKNQLFIDVFSSKYSPLVLLSALLLIIIPPLFGISFSFWATRAIVLLVAAAPCALVMSTPVAIAAGIGRAGRNGVLIKGGVHLENLGKIKAVAFDKTGTLTKGEPIVTDIVPLQNDKDYVLQLAYSVNQFSEHPLASAIAKKAEEEKVKILHSTNFRALVGHGAQATIDKNITYVGKEELFSKVKKNKQVTSTIESFRSQGKTVILVGTEISIAGIIAIRDAIRIQAKEVIKELHRMSIQTVMLTGDNQITAQAIAKEIGLDEVKADLKPEDKVTAIKTLEKTYGAIAMIGDGINDAPALATATVGIAMGTAGTDAAIEAADVALMGDDLTKVPYAIMLGKKAQGISRQNIIFSILLLVFLIPSALIGFLSVATAVIFHETSELLAVVNGLRVAK